jgi:hypothetical protein
MVKEIIKHKFAWDFFGNYIDENRCYEVRLVTRTIFL